MKNIQVRLSIVAIILVSSFGSYWLIKKNGSTSSKPASSEVSVNEKAKSSSSTENKPSVTLGTAVDLTESQTEKSPGVPVAGVAKKETSVEAPQKDAAKEETKEVRGCFESKFVHQAIDSHSDGEKCLKHRNQITLPHEKPIAQSVCIRVNGKAVKHEIVKGKKNQIVIGAEAGPNALITANYCVGAITESTPCKIEKDSFLSALGIEGEAQADSNGFDSDSSDEKEMRRNVASLGSSQSDDPIFKGWVQK